MYQSANVPTAQGAAIEAQQRRRLRTHLPRYILPEVNAFGEYLIDAQWKTKPIPCVTLFA